jgi:hypothetical protein
MNNKEQFALPMELPLPIDFYTGLNIASRSTLWRWQQAGLKVLKEGNRIYVVPADLVAFLARNAEETDNPQEPNERN